MLLISASPCEGCHIALQLLLCVLSFMRRARHHVQVRLDQGPLLPARRRLPSRRQASSTRAQTPRTTRTASPSSAAALCKRASASALVRTQTPNSPLAIFSCIRTLSPSFVRHVLRRACHLLPTIRPFEICLDTCQSDLLPECGHGSAHKKIIFMSES